MNKYSCASNLKGWLDIINNENEPGFEYEIKILIYSISTIIQRNILKDDIGYLLNVCIELLNSQGYNAKFELKKETKIWNIKNTWFYFSYYHLPYNRLIL